MTDISLKNAEADDPRSSALFPNMMPIVIMFDRLSVASVLSV